MTDITPAAKRAGKSDRFEVRPYRKSDREVVRRLCCETGYLGDPIDPVFEDRQLFADYLTAYYTDREPESSFVLLRNDEVEGYLLGSRHSLRQQAYAVYQNFVIATKAVIRFRRYGPASRRFIKWILTRAWREVPAAPRRVPHFHINLLPQARRMKPTRELMNAYLKYLTQCGEKKVYGQMVTFENRRSLALFKRYGFEVLNKARVSKYDEINDEPVYLCTVIKDLEEDGAEIRKVA